MDKAYAKAGTPLKVVVRGKQNEATGERAGLLLAPRRAQ